jgi:mRNA interferase MazF
VSLGPGQGGEIRKTRPCVVVSPDALNFRISCEFDDKSGFVVLDQIRTVDRARVTRRLGRLSPRTIDAALRALHAMFAT